MADLKIFTDIIEETAIGQIRQLLDQPSFANQKVRIMPDVHAGKGCVIGLTSTIGDSIIPNLVGVDIGCGVLAIKIDNKNPDLSKLDDVIRAHVPSGMNVHEQKILAPMPLVSDLKCYPFLSNMDRIAQSMGTLGGGNHFIELGRGRNGDYYLVIHTGSRNLGKQIAEHYQNLAVKKSKKNGKRDSLRAFIIEWSKLGGEDELISERLEKLKSMDFGENAPDGLECLTGEDMGNYLFDMAIAQRWAYKNRFTIAVSIVRGMGWHVSNATESVHNYIQDGIIRKGAIDAGLGVPVIIPLNMRDGFILGVGKGNADWNFSAPHGAGRIMSRSKAFKTLTMEDFTSSMEGIHTTSISHGTLDEAPMAYKPAQSIIDAIQQTVEIEDLVLPVYNFKAPESRGKGKNTHEPQLL